jgi:L-amino acid N-acyltransferase YncA
MQLPLHKTLKDTIFELDEMRSEEESTVRTLLNTIILDGSTYPQSQPLNEVEFAAYWLNRDAYVVRVATPGTQAPREIVGAFYLKPNFPGRCSHICNAGFIVQPAMRGQGIGRWMGESMLAIARDRGYRAVMFNLIFATNTPSLQLWQSLDFSILGTIPKAVRLNDDQFIDAIMMYREL